MSIIWLRTELRVILLDIDPVQYSKAVCRILRFWFIMKVVSVLYYSSFNPTSSIFAFILNAFFFTVNVLVEKVGV